MDNSRKRKASNKIQDIDSLQLVALVSLQIAHSLWALLLPIVQQEQMLCIEHTDSVVQ